MLNSKGSRYYYVQALHPDSAGNLLHGLAKGFYWEYGLTGPHTEREARRIRSIWSGHLLTMEEGTEILSKLRRPASEPKEMSHTPVQSAAAEADEAILNDAASLDVLPDFEEIGYHAAIDAMRQANFDFEAAGGGRKKANVARAWEIFQELNSNFQN